MRTKKIKHKNKNKTRKNKFIKDKCSPMKNKGEKKITCYTKDSLNKLKHIWNSKHPDMKITSNKYFDIWKDLKSLLNNTCSRESCWLNELYDNEHLREKEYLIKLNNIHTIGRCGMFRYNNQDHAMATGLYAARTLLGIGDFDPWEVNVDGEYHEEVSNN